MRSYGTTKHLSKVFIVMFAFSEDHLGTSMILGVGGNETPVEAGWTFFFFFLGNVTIYSAGDSARLSKESSL